MNLKDKTVDFLVGMYCKFFKTQKTAEQRKFIESLLYVFVATGIAKGLLFVINVVGGRVLGESLYGEYTLIISIGSFLMIPIGLGIMGGVVKNLAETDNQEKRRKIISTANNYFLLTLIFLTTFYFIFYNQISSIVKMGSNLVLLTIILVIFWSVNGLLESILQGLHEQKKWSLFAVIAYSAGFIAFIVLFLTNQLNILFLYLPTLIIYIVFIIVSSIYLNKYQSFRIFDKTQYKRMFHYGIYVFVIMIATTFLGNVDKIMINYFLGSSAVGIYQAYYFSSIMIIGILTGIFVKVFFPTAVKLKDPKSMFNKINRLISVVLPLTIIFVPLLIFFIIFLYNYQFNLTTAVLFTITTGIDIVVVMYASLLNAQGVSSIKKTTLGLVIAFLINIPLNYVLIPLWGINGAIISTGISFLIYIIYIRSKLNKS